MRNVSIHTSQHAVHSVFSVQRERHTHRQGCAPSASPKVAVRPPARLSATSAVAPALAAAAMAMAAAAEAHRRRRSRRAVEVRVATLHGHVLQ